MKNLLLVHGWGFGAGVWRPVLDGLDDKLPARAADLPGYGETTFPPAELSPGTVVCAWSLGALLAMQWAVRYPDKIARLVLVGATPRFVCDDDWREAQPLELLDGFAAAVRSDPAAALRRFATLMNQGDDHARAVIRRLTALSEAPCPDAATLLTGLDLLRRLDLRTLVPQIRVPTLVVHGERDPLMPLAAGRWLADHIADGRLEIFAGAAHAPFLSNRQRFCALLDAFADE
jgi:pimeloyl-[acyl-carrier protein] methyl ester esterase